jgi:hypothetical protein
MLKLTAFNAQGLRINYSSSTGYIAACGGAQEKGKTG